MIVHPTEPFLSIRTGPDGGTVSHLLPHPDNDEMVVLYQEDEGEEVRVYLPAEAVVNIMSEALLSLGVLTMTEGVDPNDVR